MAYNPYNYYRKSLRLKGYDYRQPGFYFITICIHGKRQLLGQITNGHLHLNNAGEMVEKWWYKCANKFPTISIHEHITMPNHFHGIIQICDNTNDVEANAGANAGANVGANVGADLCVGPTIPPGGHVTQTGVHGDPPLPKIVQWFKTMTTNEYIRNVKQLDWEPFDGKLWQRSYYEHIIRNNKSLQNISQYIINNPIMWQQDRFHNMLGPT